MATKSILDIVIRMSKEGGADKETVSTLVDMKGALTAAAVGIGVVTAAGVLVDKVYEQTVGTFIDYASEVRNVSFVTGATAEESSRLIQVADDMKITYDQLAKAMQIASKQGITPNVEGLAQLSDQYLKLAPGTERETFLLKEFGKSGGVMAEMMTKGSAAIRAMSAEIEPSLILTQQQVDKARQFEVQLDTLNDAIQGVKIKYGSEFLPVLSDAINFWFLHNEQVAKSNATMAAAEDPQARMTRAIGDTAVALQGETQAGEDATASFKDQLSSILDIQGSLDSYSEKQRKVTDRMSDLIAAHHAGTISTDEFNKSYADLDGELKDNAAAQDLWAKKFVFSMAQARLAASGKELTGDEFQFLLDLGQNMGLISSDAATMASDVNKQMDALDTTGAQSNVNDFKDAWKDLRNQPSEATYDVVVNFVEGTPPPGGGGGGCFVAGTLVTMADGSERHIEELRAGDQVLSFDEENGKFVEAKIEETFAHEAFDAPVLVVINDHLIATPEHLIYANYAWVPAGELEQGDMLLDRDGREIPIGNVERRDGIEPVYNLHTDHESHNYFANGLLVHNGKRATGTSGFIVPAGFQNDSYPLWLSSGEEVSVKRAGQVAMGGDGGSASSDNSKTHNFYGPVYITVPEGQSIDDVLDQLR